MTSRQHRRKKWAEQRAPELLLIHAQTELMAMTASILGPGDPLAEAIWKLGEDANHLKGKPKAVVDEWMERRLRLLEAARRRSPACGCQGGTLQEQVENV
jgi:hypothetical protein